MFITKERQPRLVHYINQQTKKRKTRETKNKNKKQTNKQTNADILGLNMILLQFNHTALLEQLLDIFR